MSDEQTMTLADHLGELRRRLIVSVAAIAAGFLVCYYFSEGLYDVLSAPLKPALPEGTDFIAFTGVTEPFFVYMKVAFVGGVILSSPVVLYQVWAFIAPGLYDNERRWFIGVVAASVVLFSGGALFAYFVVFPFAFEYLLGFSKDDLRPVLSMGLYFSLVTRLLIAFGVAYQMPLVVLVLSRLGIVTSRQLLRWWRYALILILVASAVLTPTPDVFNQLLMAGPLMVLYAVSVVIASVFGRERKASEKEAGEPEEGGEGGEGEENKEE